MIKICLQPGHWSKGGGAPTELETNKRVTDRTSEMLRQRGFEVYQSDWYGFNDPKVTSVDYDLFLALHCDADYPNDNGSGFADYADPASDDATIESQRICKVINDTYFPEVKINYVSHSNANTRFYYMWKYLTAKTPCVLLEMGQTIDPHDKVLLANTELIAGAITNSICKAFNVPNVPVQPPIPPTPPTDPCNGYIEEIARLKKIIIELEKPIIPPEVPIKSFKVICEELYDLNGQFLSEKRTITPIK